MARYERIFTLSENKNENPNCPIKFVMGALLKDNEKNEVLAQLKFSNISDQHITSVEVDIITYDANGNRGLAVKGYRYAGLSLGFRDAFGERTPVKITDKNTVSFDIIIKEVVRADGTKWSERQDSMDAMTENVKVVSQEASKIAKKIGEDSLAATKKLGEESAKVAGQIGDGSVKAIKKASEVALGLKDTVIMIIGALINTAIFVVLTYLTVCGVASLIETGSDSEAILVGLVGAAAFLSFPVFGHLLKKLKHGKKFRIARWVIILLLFVAMVVVTEFVIPFDYDDDYIPKDNPITEEIPQEEMPEDAEPEETVSSEAVEI